MKFNIDISYPAWFILICIAGAFLLSWFLYSRNQFHREKGFWSLPNYLLFFIRFILIFLIAFLLLSPFIKKNFEHQSDPVIILATDNSQSILLNKDSQYYRHQFPGDIRMLSEKLKNDYEINEFFFDRDTKNGSDMDFSGDRTNISSLLDYLSQQYYNKNVGAIVLATDGIYNQGSNPIYHNLNALIPVYSIALGDTNAARDLIIEELKYNSIAYLNNIVPINILLKADKSKNESFKVNVFHNNKKVLTKELPINSNYATGSLIYDFDAREPGMNRFDIIVGEIENEISYTNNRKTIFIDVIESRKKILMVGNSPHPDIFALKNIISKNRNYEVNTYSADNFFKQNLYNDLDNYDLVIVHQLPSRKYPSDKLFSVLEEKKIPVLIIAGGQTNIQKLNKLVNGINLIQRRNMFQEVTASQNNNFTYFSSHKDLEKLISKLPPLYAPFGKYNLRVDHQVLFYQKIGKVETTQPLVAFFEDLDRRNAIVFGTGLWRWPLTEYKLFRNQQITSDIIGKSIQFLSVKSDRRFFKLKNPENIFMENETVKFDAEFYNQSFEMKKGAEITLDILDEDGKDYKYTFVEGENFYSVNAGSFNEGLYKYSIRTRDQNKDYHLKGEFIVKKSDIEQLTSRADHQLLKALSEKTGGKMYYPDQMDDLVNELKNRDDIKPITYFDFTSKELIGLKWVFFLVLILFTTEWAARKFFGSY